ncbi:hypothetical protein GKE82_11340 [Conexibacter sp. W3-3-2]|uniref:RNA polymerase sigma factor n=1 Tax=Conexibacter sp. W3-3-2 TaxID=2675227 RepID=UPI0012B895ED|nr:sigma-70 family RNA polymerase sigma factor [Conexibacter sp. W3-3-2]MTD44868.1 hypothetical protein [Conexibacter sp. W3-3-2]
MTETAQACPPQHGDETALYLEHADRLFRAVRSAVDASNETVEDACQHAWAQFLRYQPDREHVVAWLRLTATRRVWALAARERHDLSLDVPIGDDGTGGTLTDLVPGTSIEIQLDAREALRSLAALRPTHRYAMSRRVAGLSYREIEAEGGLSYTQVNRHLAGASAALRRR